MAKLNKLQDLFLLDKLLNKWVCQVKTGDKICNAKIICNGNTSGRTYHINGKHPNIRLEGKEFKHSNDTPAIDTKLFMYKPDCERVHNLNQAVLEFIVSTNQPVSVVEDPAFVQMLAAFDAKYKLRNRKNHNQ